MTELPSSWCATTVEAICEPLRYGYTAGADPVANGPKMLRITDIQNGQVIWPQVPRCEIETSKLDGFLLSPGDIVFARTGGTVGKSFLIRAIPEPAVFASYLIKVSPAKGVEPRCLYWFFQSLSYWEQIALKKGGLQGNVNAVTLGSIELPFPPLNEQRRIVEKIEAMFERVEKGVENLRGAKATLALYRQSLLKSAFEGKLTADWRAQNATALETPKTLLARIQKERETRYKAALDDWQTALSEWRAGGEVGRKPGKPVRLPEIDVNAEVSLQHVVLDVSQGWSPKCKNSPSQLDCTWAVIKTTAIQPTRFNDAENKELPEDMAPREDLELSYGDVLITRAGPRKRVGVACMVKQTRPRLMLCDKAYRLTLDAIFVTPEFVELFLNAPDTQDKLEDLKSGISDSGLNLTQDKFLALPFWLPPKSEQAEITRILDTRLTAADRMEAEIDAALTRADALRQSILRRAFAGNLVPQDPTDEPAPTLLARIKAERAKAGKTKPRKTAHAG